MSSDGGTQERPVIPPASLNGGPPRGDEAPQDPLATQEFTPDFERDEPEPDANLTRVMPHIGTEAPGIPEPVPVVLNGRKDSKEALMTDDRSHAEVEQDVEDRDVVRSVTHPKAIFSELSTAATIVLVTALVCMAFVMITVVGAMTILVAIDKLAMGSASFYVILLLGVVFPGLLLYYFSMHILEKK